MSLPILSIGIREIERNTFCSESGKYFKVKGLCTLHSLYYLFWQALKRKRKMKTVLKNESGSTFLVVCPNESNRSDVLY
jgi:hypothetical protein